MPLGRGRPLADLGEAALEIESLYGEVVTFAIKDRTAAVECIAKADVAAGPLGPRLGIEEGLAEEVLQLACAGERHVRRVLIGKAVARPHHRQGGSNAL